MEIKYLGHASFLVNIDGINILFDPYIKDNPLASEIDIKNIHADFILITHGHDDHIADAVSIAKQTNAMIISNFELANYFISKGIKNTHDLNVGGEWEFAFGKVKFVYAAHSNQLPNGLYGGQAGGFLIKTPTQNFYYAGDTGLTMDMQLLQNDKIDFAFLPIGGNYTMDVKDALIASDFIKCDKIIGMHYDTFAHITIDNKSAISLFKNKNKELILPEIGKTFNV
jgi:L-ascorbate metabolism protein UlaG (beta-lactamase superfamily)